MSNDTQRRWTKTDAEDAARLLQELAQRSRKSSRPADEKSARIDSGESLPEKGREEERQMGGARHSSRPAMPVAHTGEEVAEGLEGESHSASAVRGEGFARRRLVIAANDNDGQVYACSGQFLSRGTTNQTARPTRDELVGATDRDYRRSRVDW